MERLLRLYANRRMAVLLGLGFASGLPAPLLADTLKAWLTDVGTGITEIGLVGLLVTLPFWAKFAWAPLMDRYVPPFLGRRRGWLLVTQVLLVGALGVLALTDPSASLTRVAVAAGVVAFLSASQDIVADAYRADVLPPDERGAGSAVFVSGYRVAMIVGGAGALLLVGRHGLSWHATYGILALLLTVGIAATLAAPETAGTGERAPSLADAMVQPLVGFFATPQGRLTLLVAALFKLPDALAGAVTVPFLLRDLGFDKVVVGEIRQAFGFGLTIVGALAGGWVVARAGIVRSLWVFGVLQAVSNLGFLVLARVGPDRDTLVGVVAVESLCGGLTTAGFLAFLISRCDPRHSATQFALLTSLMVAAGGAASAASGYLQERLGWEQYFLATVTAGIPGMALLPWIRARAGPGE